MRLPEQTTEGRPSRAVQASGDRPAPRDGTGPNRALVLGLIAGLVACSSMLVFPTSMVSGDMMFALAWGEELARGELAAFLPGPTPHPLPIVFGAAVSPLEEGFVYAATQVLFGHLAVAVIVAAAFDLAWRLGSAWGGLLSTSVLVTSPPILVWAAQAGYDLAFAACVLVALALEVARPRRGWSPLALLMVAGLLRPEGWVLAGAYWLWLLPRWRTRQRVLGALCVLAAPIAWVAMDLAVTGDPLWSFHHTSTGSENLYQRFSKGENLEKAGRDFVTFVGPIGALGAFLAGAVLARRRSLPMAIPAAALLLTGGIFAGLVAFGMASNIRYLLVPACLVAVAAGVVGAGARSGAPGRSVLAAAFSLLILFQGAVRLGEPADVRKHLVPSAEIVQQIEALMERAEIRQLILDCPRVAVPSVRLLGHWGYFAGRAPRHWISDPAGTSDPDVHVSPGSARAADVFLTRARFDDDPTFGVPVGLRTVANSDDWDIRAAPDAACARPG